MKKRWQPKKAEVTYDVFFFTVRRADDGALVVEQHPDKPAASRETLDSLLVVDDEDQSGGFALNITWLDGKPAPESQARKAGLLAVLDSLTARLPEGERGDLVIGVEGEVFG